MTSVRDCLAADTRSIRSYVRGKIAVRSYESPQSPQDEGQTFFLAIARNALDEAGLRDWEIAPGPEWCYVEPKNGRTQKQGWKIHISATLLSAPIVLTKAIAVIARFQQPFKYAGTFRRIAELGSTSERGSGGKFITIYPHCGEDEIRILAEELHQATKGLPGPKILSDRQYKKNSLVHYRYGVFSGISTLHGEGSYEAMLLTPQGDLQLDKREARFSPPKWVWRDPFTRQLLHHEKTPHRTSRIILNNRYSVHGVIRQSFSGGVYRATDHDTGSRVIIKQGRAHARSNLTGGDIRDARRHEAAMLQNFAETGLTPKPIEIFEEQGDVFLALEEYDGVTLREWVQNHHRENRKMSHEKAMLLCRDLLDLIHLVHEKGLTLRDFNPNNIIVIAGDELRLIDLEMLALSGESAVRGGTQGYSAPEQCNSEWLIDATDQRSDLFSLGATMFYILTGADPILPTDMPEKRPFSHRIAAWLEQHSPGGKIASFWAPLISALMHEDPHTRPCIETVRQILTNSEVQQCAVASLTDKFNNNALNKLIGDATHYIIDTMHPGSKRTLWPLQDGTGGLSDPLNIQFGAAGTLGSLIRAGKAKCVSGLMETIEAAAHWINGRVTNEPRMLPGLHFGRSGTAWSLLDAAVLLQDSELLSNANALAKQIPLSVNSLDICHGVSGAGMTQLHFWHITADDLFLQRTKQAADCVAERAVMRNGKICWPIPAHQQSRMGPIEHYGFAHGIAGIGAFLLAASRALSDTRYLDLAVKAAWTLEKEARVADGCAYWSRGPASRVWMTNWCSGSAGVGTFLARMWEATGEEAFGQRAVQAAMAVHSSRWREGSTSQCHGLAGNGELLLDLHQITGDEKYHSLATDVAATMYVRHSLRDGLTLFADESLTSRQKPLTFGTHYGTGMSGVMTFLLRLRDGGPSMWQPTSLTDLLSAPKELRGNPPRQFKRKSEE